jgi:molybdopterin-containing oxidoreductase family iron-sulfur binding subunit
VRHFNFLHYTKEVTGPLALMMNPNVTVRYRGVMEKCSFCIQRISAVRIDAKRDDKPIADGEVVTACQQSCPTMAITFGNLNDTKAAVTKLAAEPTNYGLLDELQTKPRTTYLPRFTNPKA